MRPREQGIALIAVLWITVLLAILAAGVVRTTRTESHLARNLVEDAKAEAIADAGVYRAIAVLTQHARSQSRSAVEASESFSLGDGEVGVVIEHEGGKVDLNVAASELLLGLFRVMGLDESTAAALTDAVLDFRDDNHEPRPLGAEDAAYRAAGLAYGAKDAPFEVIEELQRVPGMTPELYRRIHRFVTVYSWQRGINPFTAPPEVLSALPGLRPEQIEAFLTERKTRPTLLHSVAAAANLEATAGEAAPILIAAAFSRQRSLNTRLQARRSNEARRPESLEQGLAEFVSVDRTPIYTIRALATTRGGARFMREAVVAINVGSDAAPPYRIYRWHRTARGQN